MFKNSHPASNVTLHDYFKLKTRVYHMNILVRRNIIHSFIDPFKKCSFGNSFSQSSVLGIGDLIVNKPAKDLLWCHLENSGEIHIIPGISL